jgi:Pyruvate/2-oxoacid:ferredoxin oxidoreductase delta subunit
MMSSSSFRRLSAFFGFETSETLPKILAMLMSEKEAEILLALPDTPKVLAHKLSYDIDWLVEKLDDLYLRGLVFINEHTADGPRYELIDDVGGYMDSVLFDRHDDRLGIPYFELWREFANRELFAAKGNKNWGFRVIPVRKAIPLESHVLPYEQAAEIAGQARRIAVQPCPCRKRERKCDSPIETCIAFDELAEYAIYRQTGRELDTIEALAILKRCAELGLVHQTANTDKPDVICSCCDCCCGVLSPVLHFGMDQVTSKSRFRSAIDYELCVDCMACIDQCRFGALEDVDGKLVAYQEKCYGCGQCVTVCSPEAIVLIEAYDPGHIPVGLPGFSLSRLPTAAKPK